MSTDSTRPRRSLHQSGTEFRDACTSSRSAGWPTFGRWSLTTTGRRAKPSSPWETLPKTAPATVPRPRVATTISPAFLTELARCQNGPSSRAINGDSAISHTTRRTPARRIASELRSGPRAGQLVPLWKGGRFPASGDFGSPVGTSPHPRAGYATSFGERSVAGIRGEFIQMGGPGLARERRGPQSIAGPRRRAPAGRR
jgi:hypothetical protein